MLGNQGYPKQLSANITRPARPLKVLVVGAGVSGISVARGLLRDGHDVTLFDQRSNVQAGGGAVTIWPNGEIVLRQLGVDMSNAGQLLADLQILTPKGQVLVNLDMASITKRLDAPVRMVARRVLLERLMEHFPIDRIHCNRRAVGVVRKPHGIQVAFEDGTLAEADLVIGADGLHPTVRSIVGTQNAKPTGWCSWQGLVTLPDAVSEDHVGKLIVGQHGNLGLWPAGSRDLQWSFDLPWSYDFARPQKPIELIRSHFTGWSDSVDRVLDTLTDDDLASSPFPHFRHPIPRPGHGALTLLGDAAHTMPPTFAQGTNQALLDTMVLCKALSKLRKEPNAHNSDLCKALRWYEKIRRRPLIAVSRLSSLQLSQREAVLQPAALIPDRLHTWSLAMFLHWTSHRRIAATIDRDLAAAAPI